MGSWILRTVILSPSSKAGPPSLGLGFRVVHDGDNWGHYTAIGVASTRTKSP